MRKYVMLITVVLLFNINQISAQDKNIEARSEYIAAEDAYNNGDLNGAIEHLNMSEQLAKPNYLTSYLKVKTFMQMQQDIEAYKSIQTFFELAPESIKDSPKYMEMVRMYGDVKQKGEAAIEEYNKQWNLVKNSSNPEFIHDFFNKYPYSEYASMEDDMLKTQEDYYYKATLVYLDAIQNINDQLTRLHEYLKYYPDGKYVNDVNSKITKLNLKNNEIHSQKNELNIKLSQKQNELNWAWKKEKKSERTMGNSSWWFFSGLVGVGLGVLLESDGVTYGFAGLSAISGMVWIGAVINNSNWHNKRVNLKEDIKDLEKEINKLSWAPFYSPQSKTAGIQLTFTF